MKIELEKTARMSLDPPSSPGPRRPGKGSHPSGKCLSPQDDSLTARGPGHPGRARGGPQAGAKGQFPTRQRHHVPSRSLQPGSACREAKLGLPREWSPVIARCRLRRPVAGCRAAATASRTGTRQAGSTCGLPQSHALRRNMMRRNAGGECRRIGRPRSTEPHVTVPYRPVRRRGDRAGTRVSAP